MLLIDVILFIIGILLLWKGADILVEGASKTAAKIGISSLIISLTVVAYGTSLPEFAISFLASLKGHTEIALGNILGSCIANILLVLGVASLVKPLKIERSVVKKEVPIMLGVTVLLILMSITYILDIVDGILFLILLFIYMGGFAFLGKREKKEKFASDKTLKNVLFILLGLIGVGIGAKLLVGSAISIANFLNISETIIALSMIAIGTSLPELAVSSVASYKNESDISIGNVIGSNIFNILLVLGVCSIIIPIEIDPISFLTMFFLLLITIIIIPMLYTGYVLSRKEGVVLLTIYGIYLIYLFT